jgi:PhnB protein
MRMNPHLHFDGHCEAAFEFYKLCFGGGTITKFRYEDTPPDRELPPEWRKKIIHSTFTLDDLVLTGADVPPDRYQKPQGFSLLLNTESQAVADLFFRTLAENGKVTFPMQETFWARLFGMLVDQFGIPWTINCGK